MKESFSSRSIISILLVIGLFIIAIIDDDYRPVFVNLAFMGVGGYLGQLYPKQPPIRKAVD